MVKAYQAMLHFLEDEKNGIGAKQIIGYGHSIGGAVQAEALLSHPRKEKIKYVFVKRQTFSNLFSVMHNSNFKVLKLFCFLAPLLGWNMSCVKSSKHLKAPEIIIQKTTSADTDQLCTEIKKADDIISDGVIPAEASLGKKLLNMKKNPDKPWPNKFFMGIQDDHNYPLSDHQLLVEKINEMLNSQNSVNP